MANNFDILRPSRAPIWRYPTSRAPLPPVPRPRLIKSCGMWFCISLEPYRVTGRGETPQRAYAAWLETWLIPR